MKIAIIGVGGVGGYFGGRLANAGNEVTFVARGRNYKALKELGLVVKSILGDFTVNNVNAVEKISELKDPELIILAVKSWQVKEIAPELMNIVTGNTVILPLQNGVVAADELMDQINPENVICGLCRIISKMEAPGVISHFGIEPVICIGENDNSKTERVKKIVEVLKNAGINAQAAEDIHAELWKKFIMICVSALLGVTRSTYGELRELPQTRKLIYDIISEVYTLSQKAGIKIEPGYVDKVMTLIDGFPYDSTSSLTRDVWEGNPSEIEYQNGYVSKLGEKLGVPTPTNTFVYHCILPMELRARKK